MPGLLDSGIIREVIELDSVDSTNTFALNAGRPGLLVYASEQTSGRGRMGKEWFSPKASNLYMTITVTDADPRLSIVTGVAVRDVLYGIVGNIVPVEIKWPNDILAGGRKICGILCETRKVTAIGIGINVNQTGWPADLESRVISLAEVTGCPLDKNAILKLVVASLDKWLALYSREGFGPVRDEFLRHGLLRGHRLETEDGLVCTILDIDMQGHLLIDASGTLRTLVSSTLLLKS